MADEIGEALQRVASASETSNISLEKTASWLATISSITRESASTIGRSLNSAISRFESIKKTGFNSDDETKLNDVVKALSDIGIKATDSQGQLLDFAIVMDMVGERFDKLSKNEKAYIATTMFGTFQRNRGLTLLNNYQQSLINYENALNSAGAAEQKFAIYQESAAASLDRFKTSVEGFWQSFLSGGLIKGTLDALTYLMDAFGNLTTVIITMVAVLALWKGTQVTSAFMAWTASSRTLGLALSDNIRLMIVSRGALAGLTEAQIGNAIATRGMTLAWNGLKVAFLSNPIGAIATALLTAVVVFDVLKTKVGNVKDEFEELVETSKKQIETEQNQANQHKVLMNQYEQDIQKANELISTRNKLAQSVDELSDADSEKIDVNAELVISEQKLGEIIGQEALNKLRAAGFSQDATKIVVQALQEKQNAEKLAYENSMKLVAQHTENLKKNIIAEIQQIDKLTKAYGIMGKLQETGLWLKGKLALAGTLASGASEEEVQQVKNDIEKWKQDFYDQQRNNRLEELITELNGLGSSAENIGVSNLPSGSLSGSGSSSSSSTSSKEKPAYTDPTDAIIRQINLQSLLTKEKNETLKSQLEEAKSQKDYNTALEKTNLLIQGQAQEKQELLHAFSALQWEENTLSKNLYNQYGYETWNWMDKNGEATIDYINLFNSSSKKQQEILTSLFDRLQKYKKAYIEVADSIDTATTAQDEFVQSLKDIRKEQYDSIISANTKIADDSISILKNAIEMVKDLEIKAIDKRMESEDKRHENVIKNLDAELKALQDLEDANDYAKDLTKSQQEVRDLQNELTLWERDDSIEAIAKRAELSKQLKEKQEGLAEKQHDHDVELRKKDLKNQKAIEDNKYNNVKNSLEKEKKDREYYWNEILNNEQKFSDMRTQIINGNTSEINSSLNEYLARFKSANKQNIQEIGASWTALQSQISSIANMKMDLPKVQNPSSYAPSSVKTVYGNATDIANAQNAAIAAGKASQFNFVTVNDGNAGMAGSGDIVLGGTAAISNTGSGTRIGGYTAQDTLNAFSSYVGLNNSSSSGSSGGSSSSNSGSSNSSSSSSGSSNGVPTKYYPGTTYGGVPVNDGSQNYKDYLDGKYFADGGQTEKTGIHWLDGKVGKPERVLSAEQTISFNKLVDILPKLSLIGNLVNFKLPNYSNLAFTNGGGNGSSNNITINFDNFRGTVQDQQNVSKTIVNTMKKLGLNI